jgi:hypothetical protein
MRRLRRREIGAIDKRRDGPDAKTGFSMRALPTVACRVLRTLDKGGDLEFPDKVGEIMVGSKKSWLKIVKLGGLPGDIAPHVPHYSFAGAYTHGRCSQQLGPASTQQIARRSTDAGPQVEPVGDER